MFASLHHKTNDSGSEKNPSRPLIQPKLEISLPDDKYEKEANAVADQVMMQPDAEKETVQMHPLNEEESLQMQTMNGIERFSDSEKPEIKTHAPIGIQRQESSEASNGDVTVVGSALRILGQTLLSIVAPTAGRTVSIGFGPFDTVSSAKAIADAIAEGETSGAIRGALGLINSKIGTAGVAFSWHGALSQSARIASHGRHLLRFSGWGTVGLLAYDLGKFVVFEARTIDLDHPERRSQQRYEWEGHGWIPEE